MTYHIDVDQIMRKRRGQYDLEDEFLWFELYARVNGNWRRVSAPPATLSDKSRYSDIVLDCPNIEMLNEKQNFVEVCAGEPWMPASIVIRLNKSGTKLTRESEDALWMFEDSRLLFLKKAGPGIGGGYDVTPIAPWQESHMVRGQLIPEWDLDELIIRAIQLQNMNPRYRRDVFVLQEGIINPMLTPLGQKMDLRLYMLLVGDVTGRVAFYACRVGDVRNTAAYPYDPTSTDVKLQITNVAQNKNAVTSTDQITRIFSVDTTPAWYDEVFDKFLLIARRIAVIYGPLIKIKSPSEKAFVTLIGLDAVVDADTMEPMIVEINRRPTVYTPQEAVRMNYSSVLFMRDVFELGVDAIAADDVGREPASGSQFVLI